MKRLTLILLELLSACAPQGQTVNYLFNRNAATQLDGAYGLLDDFAYLIDSGAPETMFTTSYAHLLSDQILGLRPGDIIKLLSESEFGG